MTLTQTAKDAATAQVAASKAVSDAEAELQRLEDLGTAAQNELDAQKVKVTAAKATLTTMQGDATTAAAAVTAKQAETPRRRAS